MSLVNAECNTQLRPLIQISYQSSTIIKALNLNMNVDRTDILQLKKELDKHTRNPIVLGCPKSRSASWFCVAHNGTLTFYNAISVTALLFFNESEFFWEEKLLRITQSQLKHVMNSYQLLLAVFQFISYGFDKFLIR